MNEPQMTQPQPTSLTYSLGRSALKGIDKDNQPTSEQMVQITLHLVTGQTVIWMPIEFARRFADEIIKVADMPDPTLGLSIAKTMPTNAREVEETIKRMRDGH